jgi:hypothetical protein
MTRGELEAKLSELPPERLSKLRDLETWAKITMVEANEILTNMGRESTRFDAMERDAILLIATAWKVGIIEKEMAEALYEIPQPH